MAKGGAPDSPDPQALIKAQTDANRVNQYTPFGNLQYGKFDENGNFVPNTDRESSIQTQRPQDQQFQNYTDAGRLALLNSIFGNYTPATGSSSTANSIDPNSTYQMVGGGGPGDGPAFTGQPAGNGSTGLANAMAKSSDSTAQPQPFVAGYGKQNWTPYVDYNTTGITNGVQYAKDAANAAATPAKTAATPNPYGSGQGGGIGSFGNFSLANRGDPNSITSGVSGWGDAGGLKSGLTNFYDLNGIKSGLPGVSSDFSADRQKAEDAAYKSAVAKFQPDFAEQQRRLEQRLADTGNVMGSEGYNTEMDRFNRNQNDAYNQAAYNAVNAGTNMYDTMQRNALATRGQLFGEDTSLAGLTAAQRAQQFGENNTVFNAQNALRQAQTGENTGVFNANNATRSNQLAEAMGLLGIQSPQAQFTNTPQVDAAGIMQNDYTNRLNAYNSQMGGLGSLLGTGAQLFGGYMGWL